MRILIEVKDKELEDLQERLNEFESWRVLPPETILYEPGFDIENPPYEGAEELPEDMYSLWRLKPEKPFRTEVKGRPPETKEDRQPVSMPSQFGPTTRQDSQEEIE